MRHMNLQLAMLALSATFFAVLPGAQAQDKSMAPPDGVSFELATLSFDDALGELDRANLSLAQARSRVDESQAMVEQARAGLLPILAASGSFTRNSDAAQFSAKTMFSNLENSLNQSLPVPIHIDTSQLPSDMIIQPLQSFSGSGSVRVPLAMPSAWADTYAAKSAARAVVASLETVRLDLQSMLAQTAWLVTTAEGLLVASENAVTVAREHRDSAARSFEAGVGTHLALLQAGTDLVRRESDLVRARSDLDRVRLALGVLLGRSQPVRIDMRLPVSESVDVKQAIDQGQAQRPEIRMQNALIYTAEQQARAAWLRYMPQLSSSFTAYGADVAYPTGKAYGWKATVDLNWNIFDGGFGLGRLHQARASLVGAQANLRLQRLEIDRQVRDAERDLRLNEERLRLAEKQSELANATAEVAKRSFAAGMASSLDVIDANDGRYLAAVTLADARARLGIAHVLFGRAIARQPRGQQ